MGYFTNGVLRKPLENGKIGAKSAANLLQMPPKWLQLWLLDESKWPQMTPGGLPTGSPGGPPGGHPQDTPGDNPRQPHPTPPAARPPWRACSHPMAAVEVCRGVAGVGCGGGSFGGGLGWFGGCFGSIWECVGIFAKLTTNPIQADWIPRNVLERQKSVDTAPPNPGGLRLAPARFIFAPPAGNVSTARRCRARSGRSSNELGVGVPTRKCMPLCRPGG
jgi:hypothetical protein